MRGQPHGSEATGMNVDMLARTLARNATPLISQLLLPDETEEQRRAAEARELNTSRLVRLINRISQSRATRMFTEEDIRGSPDGEKGVKLELISDGIHHKIINMERRAREAFRMYGTLFPPGIWSFCTRRCFVSLALEQSNFFCEVLEIHDIAESYHKRIEKLPELVPTRRPGIAGSDIAYNAQSSRQRPEMGTDRQEALQELAKFTASVLPFLYAKKNAPNGTAKPQRKICSEAICCILGVSRNFLYRRKQRGGRRRNGDDDETPLSVVDLADVRLYQHRRNGSRYGYPLIDELLSHKCGCTESCFARANIYRLHREYNEFAALAMQLSPRRKEHRYLLKVMFCPLLNRSVGICDNAIANLYTVSEVVVAEIRMVIENMCQDPTLDEETALSRRVEGYEDIPRHPMNRYPDAIRERVETHLEMIIRPDPGASDGVNVCRVYSPEINTQEKLRKVVSEFMEEDDGIDVTLSPSTLQRMIKDYLAEKGCSISFTQSDHNACPTCKTAKYAILQFSFDIKYAQRKVNRILMLPRPLCRTDQETLDATSVYLTTKEYQESTVLESLQKHNLRHAKIRKFLKDLTDNFRRVENSYRILSRVDVGWKMRSDHGMITHQDDMTKVDLPNFVVTASADITRWRYNVNAHINAVNEECMVYSHEQGSGQKNASTVTEQILLDHLLRCKGEGIKVVVSDNASVGKNWLTVIALPQYIVDQGLADVAMVVFLENNHGKWLADMLFRQLQIRKRRSTILGIDGLLREFEEVNRKGGSVHGFGVNPLSSVDFYSVFASLGYETKPPKGFAFVKRDIHFATACAPGAKMRLSTEVKALIGDLLPTEEGMVRICSDPPDRVSDKYKPYENRHFDVPAVSERIWKAMLSGRTLAVELESSLPSCRADEPLVVPLTQPHSESGNGVVSSRTMDHGGYNGLGFRMDKACPELRNDQSRVVREAWPPVLTRNRRLGDSPVAMRCAPENWVVRKPVSHFRSSTGGSVARYPPP